MEIERKRSSIRYFSFRISIYRLLKRTFQSISNKQFPPIPPTETDTRIGSKTRFESLQQHGENHPSIKISSNYRNMLLIWARQQCQGYPGIYIEDFTRSWRNGRAFLAILHRHKSCFILPSFRKLIFSHSSPQLININDTYHNSNRENLARAFDFAHQRYGIMQFNRSRR